MALFSKEQLEQFENLLKPLDARLSDIDKQQGDLWETSVRQSVQNQFGHSFSKEFTVASLQHLAKLVCRSTGWSSGSDAVDICRVSEKLASRLLQDRAAERLLEAVFEAFVSSAGDKNTFAELGEQLQADPWFDKAGNLDISALGRSLPAFDEEESKHIKSKLEKVYRLFTQEQKGSDWASATESTIPTNSECSCVINSGGCSGQVSHLFAVLECCWRYMLRRHQSIFCKTQLRSRTWHATCRSFSCK